MGWDWKEAPWLSFKDWSLKSLIRGASGIFKCPAEVPPVLALFPDVETPEKRVPVLIDAGKNVAGEFCLKVMAQLEGATASIGAIFGVDATGAAPTKAPVYIAGLDTNATPKVVPIRVTDTTGVVHVILTAGAAEIGKLAAGTAEIGKLGAGVATIGKVDVNKRSLTTDRLSVASSEATDTVAAPGAGYKLRVYGYAMSVSSDSLSTSVRGTWLKFLTAGTYVGRILTADDTDFVSSNAIYFNGDYIDGGENEALTLTAPTYSGGTMTSICIVYYEVIAV